MSNQVHLHFVALQLLFVLVALTFFLEKFKIYIKKGDFSMEFRQLQHFLVVAQELNFSKAAIKSYISQQALSKSIKTLEDELEVSLFERLPRGLALTEYGQILLKHSYKISEELLETYNDIRHKKNASNKNVVIALTAGVEDTFPLSIIFDYQENHPDIQLNTLINNDHAIEKMLLEDKVDFALVGAVGNSDQFEYFPLIKSQTRVIVHRDNPLSQREIVSLDDLKDETFLFSSTEYNVNKHLLTICGALGFTPKICHQSAGIGFWLFLASEKQGIILAPDTVDYRPIPDTLKVLKLENDPYLFFIHIAQKKNAALTKGAENFKRHILNNIKHY